MMQAARHRLESDEELQNHTNDLRSMLDCREPRTTRCATLLHARQTKSQTIAASLTNKTATPNISYSSIPAAADALTEDRQIPRPPIPTAEFFCKKKP